MTPQEARTILEAYRPGRTDPADPELASALELTRCDADLGVWFRSHCDFQDAMTRNLRGLAPPTDLKARLRDRRKVVAMPRPESSRRQPRWWALAAILVLCLGISVLWFRREPIPDGFANYRARMVRSVLREYRMDVRSSDMNAVRSYMTAKGAPDNYLVPGGLAKLKLMGGGFLRWRSQPVAMVCFAQPSGQMAYLFVMERGQLRALPPTEPEITTVNGIPSAAWTVGEQVYLLTGNVGPDIHRLL